MQKKIFFQILLFLSLFFPALCIEDGEFIFGNLHWIPYYSAESSVAFYPSPFPDPYVRILAHGSWGYAGIYQQETQQSQGSTIAIFNIKSVSTGLGALITIGWTDISGDFGSYYKEITQAGVYEVVCTNTAFPYVTVQADGSNVINAIVEVDSIQVLNTNPTPTPTKTPTPTPTKTPTPTPTKTPTPTPTPSPSPSLTPTPTPAPTQTPDILTTTEDFLLGKDGMTNEEKEAADCNDDGVIDIADLICLILLKDQK